MKHIKHFMPLLMALPLVAVSCSDEDYSEPTPAGNPVITATAPAETVLMGNDVTLTVNCKDGQVALSTLKAQLSFSGEVMTDTTIRTKTDGDYTVKLNVPYCQYIPDGKVDVVLTLQNVSTKSTTETLSVNIARPHFTNLQFIANTGETYAMTETSDYLYETTIDTRTNGFKGHFATADGKFVFGSSEGTTITLGETGDFAFTTAKVGKVKVTFDAKSYTATPVEELNILPIDLVNSDAGKVWTGDLEQGAMCTITADGASLDDDWFYDTDFFTRSEDGTYIFNAVSGKYSITADFTNKYLRIWALDGTEPETINADGTGALWIIGNEGINKPTWSTINHGWWTGTDSDICLTQVSSKVHQITLTVGKQLRATDVNFKFFGQPNWGVEFKGTASDYHLSTESEIFGVGDGNGHDDGNIYLKDGATLTDGEVYVLTVDLTNGTANGVLKVEKK